MICINDGDVYATAKTTEEAIKIIADWYQRHNDGYDICVPDFREILSQVCYTEQEGERSIVCGIQCALNEWGKKIARKNPDVFPDGEPRFTITVSENVSI
jgi:hypothetical protein